MQEQKPPKRHSPIMYKNVVLVPLKSQDRLGLAVELASLDVHAVLADRHAEVLHCQHRPVLAAALAAAAEAGPLDAERRVARGASFALVLAASGTAGARAARRTAALLPGHGEAGRRAEGAHGVVGVGVARADAAVLVRVGRDVGDELLRRQRQQPRQPRVCLWRRRQPSLGHVVVRDGVRDLSW
jgi:hypothetical protein